MKIHQLLAKTALHLLDGKSEVGFNMMNWASFEHDREKYPCGTSCCFIGHAILLRDEIEFTRDPSIGFRDDNKKLSICTKANDLKYLVTVESEYPGDFIFVYGSGWDDDIEQCATRLLMWLDDQIPKEFEFGDLYPIPKDLRQRLTEWMNKE